MGTTHLDALQVAGVPTMGVNPLPLANNYWFVSSLVGNDGFQGNLYGAPFATTTKAISSAAAGDCIVWLEGHAETITAAAGIAWSTASLYGIGLGTGAFRPSFTFTTSTAATFLISAANSYIANIVGICGIDQIVSPFSITGAGCTLGSQQYGVVEWQDPSSSFQAIRPVLTSALATNLNINLKVTGVTSGGTAPVNGVRLVGAAGAIVNLDFYGRASTATVEFVTTACTNVEIYGYMYNASNSASSFAKDVVDTVTGSKWFANFNDGFVGYALSGGSGSALGPAQAATVIADLAVPSTDSTANLLERDVIGSKADTELFVPSATASQTAYLKGLVDLQERVATSATAALGNGTTLFTVAGGAIKIEALYSVCITTQGASATTLQYSITPTAGSAQTISNASASLTGAQAGATVTLAGTALATAALFNNNGPNLIANPGTILCPAGIITSVVTNATTGTWKHVIRYKPLAAGVTVS